MKKRTKIFIIVTIAVIVVAVAGYFIGKYYLVNYAFDKFFETGMASLMEAAEKEEQPEGNKDTPYYSAYF